MPVSYNPSQQGIGGSEFFFCVCVWGGESRKSTNSKHVQLISAGTVGLLKAAQSAYFDRLKIIECTIRVV